MIAAFKYLDFVLILSSNNSSTANIFKTIDSIILTKSFVALTKKNHGIIKKIPFFIQDSDNKDIKFGLYKIYGEMISDKFSRIAQDILLMLSKKHKEIVQKNNRNASVFADRELFQIYFEIINLPEIKFTKVLFKDE